MSDAHASLTPPLIAPPAPGDGPLEGALAACEQLLARPEAPNRDTINLLVLAGGGGSGQELIALLPRLLGLRASVACSLAAGGSGAAGLAALRMAEACCRGDARARVLVTCVAGTQQAHDVPPAAAALVSGRAHEATAGSHRLTRLATWSHRADHGEMTLTGRGGGFELEPSRYLSHDGALDLRRFLRERVGLNRASSERVGWAVHAGGATGPSTAARLELDDIRLQAGLSEDDLAPSRRAMATHGPHATSAIWQALHAAMSQDATDIVALGAGPGPTLEVARLERAS